jgi:hypothetical protein
LFQISQQNFNLQSALNVYDFACGSACTNLVAAVLPYETQRSTSSNVIFHQTALHNLSVKTRGGTASLIIFLAILIKRHFIR